MGAWDDGGDAMKKHVPCMSLGEAGRCLPCFAWLVAAAIVAAIFVAGCISQDPAGDGAAGRQNSLEVASIRYFPAEDGPEDETLEVVVRNCGDSPVTMSSALVDGRELKSAAASAATALKSFSFDVGGRSAAPRRVRNPSDPDVRWWQFYPSPAVPPGGFVSFMANLRGRPKPHSFELRTSTGQLLRLRAPRRSSSRREITFLAFTGDGRTALVRYSKGEPPCRAFVDGKPAPGVTVLSPADAGSQGGAVVPLERHVAKGDPVFVELEFPGGSRASAFIRVLPGVYSVAPFGNRDDEPLPEDVRRRFGFDDTLAILRLPHDVACDDVRAKEHGASATACLLSRRELFDSRPEELCGVDFCTALYRGVWNIYAPMADAVFCKPYRLHWGESPSRFMEEEDAMLGDVVRRVAPRPVAWVPERFRRMVELDGREFEQMAWCALLRGVRVVRCHHWKNDVLRPFGGNRGLEESVVRFNDGFRRLRPRLERLMPAGGWVDRDARIAVLEGWCAADGVLLLVRNLDYDNGLSTLSRQRSHAFSSRRREAVQLSYALPKWLSPGGAVDALDGAPVEAVDDGGMLKVRLAELQDFRIVWIPSAGEVQAAGSTLSEKEAMQ